MAIWEIQHSAWKEKADGVKDNNYKNCTHLLVTRPREGYALYCEEGSLVDIKHEVYFSKCPSDCLLFEDAGKRETERLKKARNRKIGEFVRTWIAGPFRWFGKLPAGTQALIIILMIMLFLPKVAASILTIAKALK